MRGTHDTLITETILDLIQNISQSLASRPFGFLKSQLPGTFPIFEVGYANSAQSDLLAEACVGPNLDIAQKLNCDICEYLSVRAWI